MVHQGGIFNCIDTEERQMTACVIMDINVTDPVGYEEYKSSGRRCALHVEIHCTLETKRNLKAIGHQSIDRYT
jgi:hypothetical protein